MCRLHFAEHFATDGLHNCQKLVNTINPLEKSILEKELASRIVKISKIIHKLNGFCYDFNKKIDELIQKYLKLSIKNKFATGDLEEIKSITTSEMVLNHLEIDEVCRKIEDICKVDFFGFDNDPQKVKLLRTNKFLQTFNGGLTCLAVSSDKKMIFTGSEDTSLRIWNIETYTQIACMTEHKATVWSVALSYDCAWAATGSLDKSVILWNIQKRRSHQIYTGHSAAVYCISFSNDSKFLISGCAGNQLKLWSTSSPECLKTIPTYSTIWCGLMSSSDNFFYGVGSYLSILSLNSQENIYSIKVHDSSVRSITKSRDDRFFITCSADKTVKIWEMVSMSLYATLSGHSQTVTSVSVTEDNLSILSSSCDDTVIVWSIKTCLKIHQFSFHNSYVYGVVSIDDQIFTVSRDSRIGLASLSSLSFKCFLNKKTFKSSSEVFKDDLVAFGSFTDVVILNVGKNSEEILLKGHEGAVWAVCLSKSFKFALSSSQSVKKNLILWDLKSFSVVAYLNAHQDSVFVLISRLMKLLPCLEMRNLWSSFGT
jgi:WD40 repeat protein